MFRYCNKYVPYLFLVPAILILTVFFFIPFFQTIGLSFNIDRYTPTENILNILLRAVDIFSLKDVRTAQKIADLAIEIDTQGTSLLEITDLEKCYQIGYDTIMEYKEKILNL